MAMSDEELRKKYNDLYAINPDIANDFLNSPEGWFDKKENQRWLEGQTSFTRQYKSFMDLLGDKEKALTELYRNQDGEWPTEERLMAFKEQNPSIGDSDIKEWFDNVNAARAHYKKEQEDEAAKYKRAKEIEKEWRLGGDNLAAALFASDYEKQRYINEPQEATFGKEAAGLGSSMGSKADLALGAAGGAADMLPGPFVSFVGPVIRGARDVGHKVTGSPYQKDWSEIAGDFGSDVAANAAAFGIANARKLSRIARGYASPDVQAALALRDQEKALAKGVTSIMERKAEGGLSQIDLAKTINDMPNSYLKTELMPELEKLGSKEGMDVEKIFSTTEKYAKEGRQPHLKEYAKRAIDQGNKIELTPYGRQVLITPELKNVGDKLTALGLRGADLINLGGPGQQIVQSVNTVVRGRGSKATTDERYIIDKYKNMYDRDWSLGFAPRKKDGDPLWEAYKEWSEERGINPDEDAYSKWQNRIGGKK